MPNPKKINLKIVSPEKIAYQGEADLLHVTTEMGEIEIYPGHVSLVSTISFGRALVKNGNIDTEFIIRHGVVSCNQDTSEVRLEAFACEKAEEIKHESIREYRVFIQEQLKRDDLTEFQTQFLTEQSASLEEMINVISRPQ